jgi:hypothetical protein
MTNQEWESISDPKAILSMVGGYRDALAFPFHFGYHGINTRKMDCAANAIIDVLGSPKDFVALRRVFEKSVRSSWTGWLLGNVTEIKYIHDNKEKCDILREIFRNPTIAPARFGKQCETCNGSGMHIDKVYDGDKGFENISIHCKECLGSGVVGRASIITEEVWNMANTAYDNKDWDAIPIIAYASQERDESVVDGNNEPVGQPGLWCGWTINEEGDTILWDGVEKFYNYIEWLQYLIDSFFGPWGYLLNGSIRWRGEEFDDCGVITVEDNVVTVRELE